MALLAFAAVALQGCIADSGDPASTIAVRPQAVIYGADGRVEVQHAAEPLRELGSVAVAAIIPKDLLSFERATVQLRAPTLGDALDLCAGEPFMEQPSAAQCTGLLLEDQTLLTAGHCMHQLRCEDVAFVFGYLLEGSTAKTSFDAADVYGCERVLASARSAPDAAERVDFAWVRLDRPATEHVWPVKARPHEDRLERDEEVEVIGFGGGLPMKVSYGGSLADARPETLDYFVTTSDTFHGDSGAPVFDASHRLIGLQVRGHPDYAPSAMGCGIVVRLPETVEVASEQNTYFDRALRGLCEADPRHGLCCADRACPRSTAAVASCSVQRRTRSRMPGAIAVGCLALAGVGARRRNRSCSRRHLSVPASGQRRCMPLLHGKRRV